MHCAPTMFAGMFMFEREIKFFTVPGPSLSRLYRFAGKDEAQMVFEGFVRWWGQKVLGRFRLSP